MVKIASYLVAKPVFDWVLNRRTKGIELSGQYISVHVGTFADLCDNVIRSRRRDELRKLQVANPLERNEEGMSIHIPSQQNRHSNLPELGC